MDETGGMDADTIAGLMGEPSRRKVIAAMILGASDLDDIARQSEEPMRSVVRALDRLEVAGLIDREGETVTWRGDPFGQAARKRKREAVDPGVDAGQDPDRASVVRTFFREGRLGQIPVQRKKRLVVLDIAAQRFELGRVYSEAAVNLELGQLHPDYAALCRAMVDEGFLDREFGRYWRSGGTVDLD